MKVQRHLLANDWPVIRLNPHHQTVAVPREGGRALATVELPVAFALVSDHEANPQKNQYREKYSQLQVAVEASSLADFYSEELGQGSVERKMALSVELQAAAIACEPEMTS